MKFALLAASCATLMCPAYGDDVTIDWDKITDMQTDFSLNARDVPEPPIKSADLSGHIQLDLFGKNLKMTVDGSVVAGPPPGNGYHNPLFSHGGAKHGKSEIVVDAVAGTIGIRALGSGNVGPITADASYCLVVNAPPQLLHLPPAAVMKMQLEPMGRKAQMMANAFPHTVEGDIVTYKSPPPPPQVVANHFAYPEAEAQIHTDGIPIKVDTHQVCDATCIQSGRKLRLPGSVEMSFANWQAGSGEMVAFSCPDGSTTDISAFPMHAITAYDLLTQQLHSHPVMSKYAAMLPSTEALFEEQMSLASRQQKETNILPTAVVSLAAGMSGGAVVLALVAAFARKTRMSEPLLSEA